MKKILCAAFGLLALYFVSGCTTYPLRTVTKSLQTCLVEHELAHVNGWPANHPGGKYRGDCPGVAVMPPHHFAPTGRQSVFHWLPPQEIPAHCGPGALACTYPGNPAHVYVPKDGIAQATAPVASGWVKASDPVVPLWKKLNPLWWVGTEMDNQQLSQAPWYHPEWPQWKRKLYWQYFRNPFQNFNAVVAGVMDRDHRVDVLHGAPDYRVVQRSDVGQTGYQISVLTLKNGVKLPFISYSGKHVVWYAGWHWDGKFGLKFNLKK